MGRYGYSSVCDDTAGCSITVSHRYGFLNDNQASSVFCYCDQPSKLFFNDVETDKRFSAPRDCGQIFENDGWHQYDNGRWATIKEGFKTGMEDHPLGPYVRDDTLSVIYANPGKYCSFPSRLN